VYTDRVDLDVMTDPAAALAELLAMTARQVDQWLTQNRAAME
jgi:hypothetical protein